MVVHRFDVDRGQVEAAGVDGAEVDFDCHLPSGGEVVDVAVGTVVADILVVDAGRFRVGRTLTQEAGIEYFPSGREHFGEH